MKKLLLTILLNVLLLLPVVGWGGVHSYLRYEDGRSGEILGLEIGASEGTSGGSSFTIRKFNKSIDEIAGKVFRVSDDNVLKIVDADDFVGYVRTLNLTDFRVLLKEKFPSSIHSWIDDASEPLLHQLDNIPEAKVADFVNDVDDVVLRNAFEETPELVESWRVLDDVGHDARLNTDLLKKIADATPEQKQALTTFYNNMAHPAGFKGKVNYSATKTVNGRSVTVKYDEYGFPEFKEFSPGEHTFIKSDNYTGVYESDNLIANEGLIKELGEDNVWFNPSGNGSPVSIKIEGKWEEFTWHHLQDGKTMIPVKQDIHSSFNHSGGKQAIDSGLKGFFEY
jgi:hypothetical protein